MGQHGPHHQSWPGPQDEDVWRTTLVGVGRMGAVTTVARGGGAARWQWHEATPAAIGAGDGMRAEVWQCLGRGWGEDRGLEGIG